MIRLSGTPAGEPTQTHKRKQTQANTQAKQIHNGIQHSIQRYEHIRPGAGHHLR